MSRKSIRPKRQENYSLVNDLKSFESISENLTSLNSNLVNLQKLHENFVSFNEGIGSLIYGLNINAWCTEFSEAPNNESFMTKLKIEELNFKSGELKKKLRMLNGEVEDDSVTILNDDSFVIDPEKKDLVKLGFLKPSATASKDLGKRRQSRIPQPKPVGYRNTRASILKQRHLLSQREKYEKKS